MFVMLKGIDVVILKCLDIRIYIYRLVCSHNRKGFEVYYTEKGIDVCHTERALMFIIIERALMFIILKGPWCCHAKRTLMLSCWKGLDVCHTERVLWSVLFLWVFICLVHDYNHCCNAFACYTVNYCNYNSFLLPNCIYIF